MIPGERRRHGGTKDRTLNLQQHDRVQNEPDREQDRPPIQIAFHQRSAARSPRGPDAEGTRHARVLPRVQQDEEDEDDRDEDLDDRKDRLEHLPTRVLTHPYERSSCPEVGTSSSRRRMSTASARSPRSSPRQSDSDSLPVR